MGIHWAPLKAKLGDGSPGTSEPQDPCPTLFPSSGPGRGCQGQKETGTGRSLGSGSNCGGLFLPKGEEEGCGEGREEGEVGRKAGKRDQEREAGKEGNKRRGSKPCAKQPKEKSK